MNQLKWPVIQNGQRMYRAGSIGAQLFALFDEKKPQTQKEGIAYAVAAGCKEKSAAKSFYQWRRFNGQTKPTIYTVFVTNNEEYLDWLKAHPQGFVLNSYKSPSPNYLILHRAQCPTIQDKIGDAYIKVCAENIEGLWEWLNEKGFEDFSKEEHFCNNQNYDKLEISKNPIMTATIPPLNQILFGPPGTGKTFSTINKALEILYPDFLVEKINDRATLKSRFDELVEAGRIVFCTFHQSFSYEDFVEGLRAISVDGQIEYRVESGVFKNICNSALDSAYENVTTGHSVSDDNVNDALRNFIIQITEEPMKLQTKSGKSFSVSYKNGSKGFSCIPDASPTGKPMQPGIEQVRQMLNGIDPAYNAIYARSISEYIKKQFDLDDNFPDASTAEVRKIPYVLIIDEINRGNISKIFGELITLIEPSKRAGRNEALAVTLPYSKESFSVPDNVYLIGTMNTADRSLANLDIALRRRFDFVSMPPQVDLLMNIFVEDVNVGELLQTMNQRIEVLLGKEHCLGHAYFMALAENSSLPLLADIFRRQIIPLLQEYFFEDWQRICWVLNDHRKAVGNRFLTQSENNLTKLFGDEEGSRLKDNRWKLQQFAFDRIDAYAGVIDHEKKIKSKLISAANNSEIRREIEFNGLKIAQLKDGGSIRIMGVADGAVKDTLRKQAVILGIDTLNGNGNECTTQELGAKIIKAFDAQKTITKDMQE